MKIEKGLIRKEILSKLRNQSPVERERKSDIIKNKLFSTAEYKKANAVMFYVSTDEEVATRRMIIETLEKGKIVAVPYIENKTNEMIASELHDLMNDLGKGHLGIQVPKKEALREVPLDKIDMVVVPGLAFDEENHRLGRGKAYYDRFLKRLPSGTDTIGICFDFQVVKGLPKESHDQPVSRVITN